MGLNCCIQLLFIDIRDLLPNLAAGTPPLITVRSCFVAPSQQRWS